jgi:hypothetical protein
MNRMPWSAGFSITVPLTGEGIVTIDRGSASRFSRSISDAGKSR